jgi:hypothetical protein
MATLKNRIEQAEDKQWLESRKRLLAAFNGRSEAEPLPIGMRKLDGLDRRFDPPDAS